MNKSGFINHVSGLPATRTHHRRFANHFTVNQRNAFETGQAAAGFLESDFHNHLIARYYRAFEACFIDTREVVQLARFQFSDAFERQNPGGLRHCFQNQDARQNRLTVEVPRKTARLQKHFYCAQKTTFFKIQHAVYQQERVTVRQKFQNLFNVQSMSVSSQNTLPV